ncbi:MAG: NAD(P)-dependent oxidoreductase [Ginsengibacter sp.]
MTIIGLIKEGKTPADNRVALTPHQCKLVQQIMAVKIIVQHSVSRCYSDKEYQSAGIELRDDMQECDILFGIKEVPAEMLLPGKTYLFFSHTKKLQPYNQHLLQTMVAKKITLVDYECLEHTDGTRIIGFGFFAGVVGAHNGMMAYGNRTGNFSLEHVYKKKNFQQLIHTYFGLKLPIIKVAVTGSGRVAHGILEIMNLMEIHETEPEEFRNEKFTYPVYVHLKGSDLYQHKLTGKYSRHEFHEHPENFHCLFKNYLSETDILMNGVYWEEKIPRLFGMDDMNKKEFNIKTIADISDDHNGSVPCNLGDGTMEYPVYGVDRITGATTKPYLENSIDIMAVGNLPNELPRDASRYFGEQLIKYVLEDLLRGGSPTLSHATILDRGKLTGDYQYMKEYAGSKLI